MGLIRVINADRLIQDKKAAIRSLVRSEKLEFICIQETKLEKVDGFPCQSLWDSSDVDWLYKESVGSSGGLICIWGTDCFTIQDSFSRNGFLGMKGLWWSSQDPCFIFNIYSPCSLSRKRALWADLKALRATNIGHPWCLAGDFNAVRSLCERRGSST